MSAQVTLTSHPSSLDAAQQLAEDMDNHFAVDALAISVNEVDETKNLWCVVAYFETEDVASAAAQHFASHTARIEKLPDTDWVRQSLEGLAPVTAGRFFLHGSHDRERRRAGGISLEIDAGTAFGTGHHGTTEACLVALDHVLKRKMPQRIFDLGCGTGVLALAAAAATKHRILATDIDPEATRVTLLNAQQNRLRPLTKAHTAPGLHHTIIRQTAPYDLIFANILARPLAALAQGISQILAHGGTLVLSGLTRDQIRWIKACYLARGLIHHETILRGNWAALVMTKPPKQKRPGGPRRFDPGSKGSGWELDL